MTAFDYWHHAAVEPIINLTIMSQLMSLQITKLFSLDTAA